MNTQHTPGPWHARKDDKNFLLVLQDGDKDATWPAIAAIDLEEWGRDRNEAHANLQLIAAAPDMLDALQRAKDLAWFTVATMPEGPLRDDAIHTHTLICNALNKAGKGTQ